MLEESLANIREELQRAENVFDDLQTAKEGLDSDSKANKNDLTRAQEVVKDLEFKLEKARATVRKLQGQREDELKKKNRAIAQVTAAEANKVIWEQARDDRQKKVDDAIEKAEKICPERVPIPQDKSADELGEEFHRLVALRKEQEKDIGGSQDELLRQANEAKREHQAAMRDVEDFKTLRNVSRRVLLYTHRCTNMGAATHQHIEPS